MQNYAAQPHQGARLRSLFTRGIKQALPKKVAKSSAVTLQNTRTPLGSANRAIATDSVTWTEHKREIIIYTRKANSAENPRGNRFSDKINNSDFNSLIWRSKGSSTNTFAPAARAALTRKLSTVEGNANFVWNHHQKHHTSQNRSYWLLQSLTHS